MIFALCLVKVNLGYALRWRKGINITILNKDSSIHAHIKDPHLSRTFNFGGLYGPPKLEHKFLFIH